ncbi:C2H2 type zinc-finger-domain-containing protein [Nemania sp. FL0916]|nr:C2H2 type zinc-finger-domain-containing protein [Nemania sp. FL0916]
MTATATTSGTTATVEMSLLLGPKHDPECPKVDEPINLSSPAMEPFISGQCLFCPNFLPHFPDSVIHMHKSHGLFIPHQQHLDIETLFKYLHLIIFGYRECIQCGTTRATVQAVQQHMTSKGHCKIDISEQDSEFAEFFDFSIPEEDEAENDIGTQRDGLHSDYTATIWSPSQVFANEESIRLTSGKIISRQSSGQSRSPLTHVRGRAHRKIPSQLEYSATKPSAEDNEVNEEEFNSNEHDTRLLSKREKREMQAVTQQLSNMSASDRQNLMHLSVCQQRSIIAMQHRHSEKVQKEERRRQGKIDRKGNKNLYAYWATETPVYQCG